jgi:hypothetical protein
MRRTAPPPSSTAHEHEYRPVEDDSALIYEDGAFFIYEQCEYEEITGSYTDHQRDETYYETGYECERERSHRFDLMKIEWTEGQTIGKSVGCLNDVSESDQSDSTAQSESTDSDDVQTARERILSWYDDNPFLYEEIELKARERLCEDSDEPPLAYDVVSYRDGVDTDSISFPVEYGGTEYTLYYKRTDVTED